MFDKLYKQVSQELVFRIWGHSLVVEQIRFQGHGQVSNESNPLPSPNQIHPDLSDVPLVSQEKKGKKIGV